MRLLEVEYFMPHYLLTKRKSFCHVNIFHSRSIWHLETRSTLLHIIIVCCAYWVCCTRCYSSSFFDNCIVMLVEAAT
jgi:hypothetical protein